MCASNGTRTGCVLLLCCRSVFHVVSWKFHSCGFNLVPWCWCDNTMGLPENLDRCSDELESTCCWHVCGFLTASLSENLSSRDLCVEVNGLGLDACFCCVADQCFMLSPGNFILGGSILSHGAGAIAQWVYLRT